MSEKLFKVSVEFNEAALQELEYIYDMIKSRPTALTKLLEILIRDANNQLENVNGVDWL